MSAVAPAVGKSSSGKRRATKGSSHKAPEVPDSPAFTSKTAPPLTDQPATSPAAQDPLKGTPGPTPGSAAAGAGAAGGRNPPGNGTTHLPAPTVIKLPQSVTAAVPAPAAKATGFTGPTGPTGPPTGTTGTSNSSSSSSAAFDGTSQMPAAASTTAAGGDEGVTTKGSSPRYPPVPAPAEAASSAPPAAGPAAAAARRTDLSPAAAGEGKELSAHPIPAPTAPGTAAAASGAAAGPSAGGGVLGGPGRGRHPAAMLMHQHSDRMIMFLVTLVTYPFAFLLTQAAAVAGSAGRAGVGGGNIDTRKRLQDFPEGAAIADLESWCREPAYSSWWREVAARGVMLLRQVMLTYLPYDIVRQVLHHPKLLQLLGIPASPPLTALVDDYMPRAQQLLADGSPHLALVELQSRVIPSIAAIKSRLEERVRLTRGPTPLERLDFITHISRTASYLFFTWLRGLARLCTYISGLLSVVSGALSFTVVPSIILSVFSAAAGIAQLVLTGTVDLMEPTVNGLLALTETSKDKAASLSGSISASPVCSRTLPSATVEQLEGFFESQLTQVSGLLNRPEIPRLSGSNKSLLVKAYDLGLIDALGRIEGRAVRELLTSAQAKSVLHILLRGGSRAAVAAAAFDVPAVLGAANELARALASRFSPTFLGGARGSVKQLFKGDGFFAYADERQAQVGLVLLCRLLSWLHLASVVAPSSQDCLHFVLVLGESQAGKAALFTRLVAAPAEYAAQLGGTAGGLDGENGGTRKSDKKKISATPSTGSVGGAGGVSERVGDAPAVDMRPLADRLNTYVCVFPGLNSVDLATSRLSHSLALALGGLASAVVYLVHPSSSPSPDKLAVLEGPLAAGRHCLVAINGPSRVQELMARTHGAGGAGGGEGGEGAGAAGALLPGWTPAGEQEAAGEAVEGSVTSASPVLPSPSTPLEGLRLAWQSAAEAFCSARGLAPSLLGVVVSELQDEGAELPPGVHKFKQVQDWIINTASHTHRMV